MRPGRRAKRARRLARAALAGLALATGAPAAAPEIPARAWILVEPQTATVLAAGDADRRLPPASLTKLMTAYVLFGELRAGRLRLTDTVTVSAGAAAQPGARMFLRAGQWVTVEELLKGMLVQSGNDATAALVEHLEADPQRFVARMNDAAAALGLADTRFANPSGLHASEHYSSAADLARLAAAVRREFPEYAGWYALREYRFAGIRQPNRNPLLGQPGVDGLKTGHTRAAGYCLVASAARDDLELVAVVLGAGDEAARERAGRTLLDYGFAHFATRRVHRGGAALLALPVRGGEPPQVAAGLERDLLLTLPRAQFARLESRAQVPERLPAPLARGARLGELHVHDGGQVLASAPLVALEPVAAASLFERLRAWLRPDRHGTAAAAAR